MEKKWHGILEILQIEHTRNGEIIWEARNLKNVLHIQGEQFLLNALFSAMGKPSLYYFGLDDRDTIALDDTLDSLKHEPTTHGYARQTVPSNNGWVFSTDVGITQAKSPIVSFTASGGSWGPVKNLFLTNVAQTYGGDAGYLISTVNLGQNLTLANGDTVSLRMAIKLRDCSAV